ncbi:MAG: 6-bladed beta-propeller [Candidatus Aminicenantes bacterium]|nr:6-bladed beta-propeller [Candidatus Aminicenantes bacterium]NIM80608.1 6-bladed beta-propeller [Candidatus Aminicenantes bacterium]NIN19989.1 6-bladed beta-propeller [Candidatus Aminicenantes bacterium]NIN47967.1 6-bladed beta-propeller [Candidatus Aminicenantes bacterium]NIN89313.1 6-bladed beta-propeller [Candidatus Aminicenantes bacterium]
MRRFVLFGGLFLILLPFALKGKVVKLDQKEGILEGQKEKQVQFHKYEKIDFDFKKVPLKRVKKIDLHDNKIFILDNQRNEIYVIDKKGKYLYKIGRRGQGPGEIVYGQDFHISGGRIYVLNSMPKKVEVFDIKGEPIRSIKLEEGAGLLKPESIIVDNNRDIFISGAFEQILAVYSSKGAFKKLLIYREDMDTYTETSTRLGIPSNLAIIDNRVYHFDLFTGIFTRTDFSGEIDVSFSAFSHLVDKDVREIKQEYRKNKSIQSQRSLFTKWSNLCLDELKRIHALLLSKKKGKSQRIFVFSKNGDFLYAIPLDYFNKNKMAVRFICCDETNFVFLTYDLNLILAYIHS